MASYHYLCVDGVHTVDCIANSPFNFATLIHSEPFYIHHSFQCFFHFLFAPSLFLFLFALSTEVALNCVINIQPQPTTDILELTYSICHAHERENNLMKAYRIGKVRHRK